RNVLIVLGASPATQNLHSVLSPSRAPPIHDVLSRNRKASLFLVRRIARSSGAEPKAEPAQSRPHPNRTVALPERSVTDCSAPPASFTRNGRNGARTPCVCRSV